MPILSHKGALVGLSTFFTTIMEEEDEEVFQLSVSALSVDTLTPWCDKMQAIKDEFPPSPAYHERRMQIMMSCLAFEVLLSLIKRLGEDPVRSAIEAAFAENEQTAAKSILTHQNIVSVTIAARTKLPDESASENGGDPVGEGRSTPAEIAANICLGPRGEMKVVRSPAPGMTTPPRGTNGATARAVTTPRAGRPPSPSQFRSWASPRGRDGNRNGELYSKGGATAVFVGGLREQPKQQRPRSAPRMRHAKDESLYRSEDERSRERGISPGRSRGLSPGRARGKSISYADRAFVPAAKQEP